MPFHQVASSAPVKRVSSFRQFALYGNLHIPLVAAGLMAGSSALIGIPVIWPLLIASCAGAFLIYQIDRVWLYHTEDRINQPDRIAWYGRHAIYTFSTFVAAAVLLGAAFLALPWSIWVMGGLLGAGGLLYLLDFGKKGVRLKGYRGIKPVVIAGAWVIGTVFLPVYATGAPFDGQVATMGIYRFTFILANVFLADWPDREGDAAADLKSLAVILGEPGVRAWATGMASLSLAIGIGQGIAYAWPAPCWVDLGGPLIMILAAQRSFSASHWFHGFVIDLIVAWPLVTACLVAWIS